ncbi:MAG: hypothetical protein F6K21_05600 [Symploca sp. SIO2D2]|nr:hypothetical protein [Symploca sp. SIO2D2]
MSTELRHYYEALNEEQLFNLIRVLAFRCEYWTNDATPPSFLDCAETLIDVSIPEYVVEVAEKIEYYGALQSIMAIAGELQERQ